MAMSQKSLSPTTILLHVCICLAFMCLPYVFSSDGGLLHWPNLVRSGHDRTYFVIYAMLLVFFYGNYFYLLPRLYFKGKYVAYFTIIVLVMLIILWLSHFLDRPFEDIIGARMQPPHDMPFPDGKWNRMASGHGHHSNRFHGKPTQNEHTLLVYIVGLIGCLCIAVNARFLKTRDEKMQAELSWLKAQINPHFLFNTLNSIYSLALAKDEKTADSIIQLSELMRYIMHNANQDEIQLEKEINYINNYIALQRSRLGHTVAIRYEVEGSSIGKTIAPLILISFIENAFKHGVNPEENSEIDIKIALTDADLTLRCFNKKVHSIQSDSGIGMQNTLERLKLLYSERHQVTVTEDEESYTIQLTLQI